MPVRRFNAIAGPLGGVRAAQGAPCCPGVLKGLTAIPAHFDPTKMDQAKAGVNAAGYFGGGLMSLASPHLLPRNARMASRLARPCSYPGSTLMASS